MFYFPLLVLKGIYHWTYVFHFFQGANKQMEETDWLELRNEQSVTMYSLADEQTSKPEVFIHLPDKIQGRRSTEHDQKILCSPEVWAKTSIVYFCNPE